MKFVTVGMKYVLGSIDKQRGSEGRGNNDSQCL